jgi:hypothetical protein
MNDEYQDESDLKSLKNEVRRLQAIVEIHTRNLEKRKVECFGKYTPDAAEVLASWLTEETEAGVCLQDMAFFRVGKEDIATKEILERLRISGLGWSNLKIDGPSFVKSAKEFKKIQKKITKMTEKLGSDWAEDVLPIGQTVTKGEYFHLLQGAKIMWKPLRTLLELSMVVSGEDGGMPLELFLETVHTVQLRGSTNSIDTTSIHEDQGNGDERNTNDGDDSGTEMAGPAMVSIAEGNGSGDDGVRGSDQEQCDVEVRTTFYNIKDLGQSGKDCVPKKQ